MPPLLALGLLAVAGLLAARLPWIVWPKPGPRRELASGLVALGCGLVLGPGIGALDHPTLERLEPLGVLAAAWVGAGVGASADRRLVRRVPAAAWRTVASEVVATIGLVGVAAWILARFVPALGVAWWPRLEAVSVFACVAALSDPGATARWRRQRAVAGEVRARARAWARIATLETAAGTLALVCAAVVFHPHPPGAGRGAVRELLLCAAAPAGLGLYALLRQLPRVTSPVALGVALLAGGGLGAAAGVSPFVSGAIGAAVWVTLVPGGGLRATLQRWDRPMGVLLAVLCGAELGGPGTLVAAAGLLATVRIVTRWSTLSGLRHSPGIPWPPEAALATVAQGRVALGAGLGFALAARGAGAGSGSGVLSTIVLGVVVAEGAAALLTSLALRRPLTRGPLAPELSPDSSAD